MIQRIQTLYLFLIVVLSVILLTGNIFVVNCGNGMVAAIKLTGPENEIFNKLVEQNGTLINASFFITILIAFLSLISIFLFRKRKLQQFLTVISALFSFFLTSVTVYLIYIASRIPDSEIIPGVRLIIPPALFLSGILAARGIKNDERLVRSIERIR